MSAEAPTLFSRDGRWLAAAAACAAVMVLALWLWFWPGGLPSGTTSGVWTALAADLRDGIFYRPVFDATAGEYGGTRYLPLFFSLEAGLMRSGLGPVAAGLLLMGASVALFDAALFRLLRQAAVGRGAAAAWTALAHASLSYQLVTLEVRADVLAAAGSLWGCWFAWRAGARFSWLAVFCFLAAFATKLTAVAGLLAVGGWLIRRGERRLAGRYLAAVAVGAAGVLAIVYGASAGRAWESFLACGGGGGTAGYAVKAPLWFALTVGQDPFAVAILGFGAWQVWRDRATGPAPGWLWVAAAAATLPLFASPGTGANHLLEMLAASLLVLGAGWAREPAAGRWKVLLGFIAAGCVVMWLTPVPTLRSFLAARGRPTAAGAASIGARLAADSRPVLSENPLLPLLWGRRPAVLDAFALRVAGQGRPAVAADFNRRLEAREFAAVVLLDWSGAPEAGLDAAVAAHEALGGVSFYGGVHFPPGFLERLHAGYALGFVERPYLVYLPRKGGGR